MATEHWSNRMRWLQRGYIWLDRQAERLRQRRRLWDLRLRGAQLGSGVRILGPMECRRGHGLVIGDRVVIGQGVKIILNPGARLVIGRAARIAPGEPIRQQRGEIAPITIGADAWIASSCIVLKGVTIGDGAVVGANSVVTADIAPQAIAVGSPARVVAARGARQDGA